jgi:hypothetical protein
MPASGLPHRTQHSELVRNGRLHRQQFGELQPGNFGVDRSERTAIVAAESGFGSYVSMCEHPPGFQTMMTAVFSVFGFPSGFSPELLADAAVLADSDWQIRQSHSNEPAATCGAEIQIGPGHRTG